MKSCNVIVVTHQTDVRKFVISNVSDVYLYSNFLHLNRPEGVIELYQCVQVPFTGKVF